MAKAATDGILDGTLVKFEACTTYTVTTAEPATYADIAANSLGSITISGADFTRGDDVSGRKSELAAKTITASASGTATHVVVDDGTDWVVTTLSSSKAVNSGDPMDVTAWAFNVKDPV